MLFNSVPFIFVYLPVVLAGFFLVGRFNRGLAILWLGAASFAFYAYWDITRTPILLASIVFNFWVGRWIFTIGQTEKRRAKPLLIAAVACNLAALGYWKYAFFVTSNIARLPGVDVGVIETVLPLGISFFTFTQIAYLTDVYQRKAPAYGVSKYFLFVTYFPHLIAGPIIHHGNIMPQLGRAITFRPIPRNLALGLVIFIIGLAKKVLVADQFSPVAGAVFGQAALAQAPDAASAWIGAIAYTLQLYFDFSGYSDMAVGLSMLFNIRLPVNFFSPYKATSIVDFWRRWHISLSSFLRDYLYIPLGGRNRRYLNLFLTMLLGGLWHGAGWTFIIWGALHGLYLVINHLFRSVTGSWRARSWAMRSAISLASGGLTFVCVVVGWVIFRADNLETASRVLHGMAGGCRGSGCFNVLAPSEAVPNAKIMLAQLLAALAAVWILPNTYQLVSRFRPFKAFDTGDIPRIVLGLRWRPQSLAWMVGLGLAAGLALLTIFSDPVSEFLYFQF